MVSNKILITATLLAGLLIRSPFAFGQTDTTTANADTTDNSQVMTMPEEENSPAGGSQKMAFPGFATTMFQLNKTRGSSAVNSFSPVGIMDFPLIKVNDKLFLDAAAGVSVNTDGTVNAELGELVVYYRFTPWLNAFIGNFSPRFGLYLGILDDFTNRFGTGVEPVGMGHGPQNQNGIGIQGGVQAGMSKLNYQLYIANGPQLTVDSLSQGADNSTGLMNYAPFSDNNKSKSIGWNIGYLPFSNSCLELDFSGEYAPKTGDQGSAFQNIHCTSLAFDLNYYHIFSPVMVRVISEYNYIKAQNTYYPLVKNLTTVNYTFDNVQKGWFAGATLRDVGAQSIFLSNLELAARIGEYTPPVDALWGGEPTKQTTATLTYYLNWDIPLSLEYDHLYQNGSPSQDILSAVIFYRF